jgi:3'-phosphoadenosine 5'-phosphosulfate sulfotransferase (PAPS reductase)/FAD synthetase
MSEIRHVLGISGGKDSAALAIYMKDHFPAIDLDLYCCDTGKELDETYDLIKNLESYLGKKVTMLEAIDTGNMAKPNYSNGNGKHNTPFDYYLNDYKGFLPSSFARWCTKNLKLKPFEEYIGDDPTISYVAIRGDEEREAYVSTKENVQTIFPFKKNIWSFDVISLVLDQYNIGQLKEIYEKKVKPENLPRILEEVKRPITPEYNLNRKTKTLIDLDVTAFNYAVFHFLKKTDYPIGRLDEFPLLDKSLLMPEKRIIVREQVFDMLEKSGVGVPQYYKKLEYEVDGQTGTYSRTRSGCFFCFYQQKIEWVWLYENNHEKFEEAMAYEKEGFTWMEEESLAELAKPERRDEIKRQHLKRKQNGSGKKSKTLLNNLLNEEEKGEYFDKEDEDYAGCTVCFI